MNSTSSEDLVTAAQPCRCNNPLRDQDTCALCGRPLPAAPEPARKRLRTGPDNPWTRAGVLRALRAFAFFRGRPPVRDDWNERMGKEWPALLVVEQLFGSLPDAVVAAGLASPGPARGQNAQGSAATG
jgi:hypothetical protein